MKSNDSTLINFLRNATAYVFADLYTFTLSTGDIFWYAGADIPIAFDGNNYVAAPCISDNGLSQQIGAQADTFELTISADGRTVMEGLPLMTFVKLNGLDQAVISAQRVYFTEWGGTLVGGITRFQGRFSEARDAGQTQMTVIVAAYTELFNTSMPFDVYQAQCLNTLFDAKCTLNQASFMGTGAINGTSTQRALVTNITAADDTYTLGTVKFTSGANQGLRRSITGQDHLGNILLVAPLPSVPAVSDAFDIYQGCDLTQGTCANKFSNLVNFRGAPFIPAPETSV